MNSLCQPLKISLLYAILSFTFFLRCPLVSYVLFSTFLYFVFHSRNKDSGGEKRREVVGQGYTVGKVCLYR